MSPFHDPRHNLIQGPIPPAGNQQVILSPLTSCHSLPIPISLRRMHSHLIPSLHKYIKNIHQPVLNTPLPSPGIKNKQHPLTHNQSSLFISSLFYYRTPNYTTLIPRILFFILFFSRMTLSGEPAAGSSPVVSCERCTALARELTCSQSLNSSAEASSLSVWGRWISPALH